MRISYSNIAWEIKDEEEAASILRRNGIDAVDVAPGKYFPDPARATREEADRVRGWWDSHGIEIIGMQALLFGVSGLNLFGEPAIREAMLDRLGWICRIGGLLGARRLVFGSPRCRDRGNLDQQGALAVALPWLRRLGERAGEHGVTVCLEPNPPAYQCDFMTTTDETAAVVAAVGHAAIRLHLDAGAMAMNGEDPEALVASHAALVGYAHVSEPHLAPISDAPDVHAPLSSALRRHLPEMPVSIEMRGAGLPALAQAIVRTRAWYGEGRR